MDYVNTEHISAREELTDPDGCKEKVDIESCRQRVTKPSPTMFGQLNLLTQLSTEM